MYKYLGDRFTDPYFKGKECDAVRRPDGKCILGKNGNMLVKFNTGENVVVIGRLLRKNKSGDVLPPPVKLTFLSLAKV